MDIRHVKNPVSNVNLKNESIVSYLDYKHAFYRLELLKKLRKVLYQPLYLAI